MARLTLDLSMSLELEATRVIASSSVTHLRFSVVRGASTR